MKVTPAERLIMVMLAEIMERLEINGDVDPTFIKTVLYNRDEWAIDWKYGSGAFGEGESVSPTVVSETASIMSMMSFLEYSVGKLPVDQQAEFETTLKFRGFDGNHDPHFHVAHTLINDLDRFSEFEGRYLNSHGSATPSTYLRLKPAYDDAMTGTMGDALDLEQLRTIAGAARY